MACQLIKIHSQKPEKEILQKAAKIIREGGLVAFPTETVYGLGANALDKKAVRKIFEVKRRPLDNPVIVHIAKIEDLDLLSKSIPKEARILAEKFWPGPLTLVLFKKKIVPDEITAGGETVAIRMPKNKIALELIKTSGVPIAAPSANLAGKPSPTTAQHVFEDLGEKVDLILDGGKTKIGLESTVVDLTVKPPQILRPGGISFEELKKL
jgi:L-threonylcarbamoyladenylate synthase